jgi:hypothetical protein
MVAAVTVWGAVLAAIGAGSALAAPAIWRVADADGLVTIAGCIHAIPKDLDWDADEILAAVDDADAVYVESYTGPEVVDTVRPLVQTRGFFSGADRLTDVLSPEDAALLEREIIDLSLDRARILRQKPWLAALTISKASGGPKTWSRASGLDSRMAAAARAQGKPVRALEDARDVITALADLPDAAAKAYLHEQLTRDDTDRQVMDDLVAAWASGDLAAVERLAVQSVQSDNPDLHAALYARRNPMMASTIAGLIDAPGSVVVALGAGHTVGADGVIARLRSMGYVVDGP